MIFHKAFTKHSTGISKALISEVSVSPYPGPDRASSKTWIGLWDTGAVSSCIDQHIVDDLHLIPAGKTRVSTANGYATANTYLVNITLPNQVDILKILVPCLNIGPDIHVLIGMDIISFGDFAVTNFNGSTTFSFRLPSVAHIDFVQGYINDLNNAN